MAGDVFRASSPDSCANSARYCVVQTRETRARVIGCMRNRRKQAWTNRMTLSTDITLPANIQPVFPSRCVVCGEESSDTAKISADAQGFIVSFFVPLMSLLGRKKIEFPICPECKPRFFRQRWIRSLICWSIIIVVVFVALPYFQGWNRSVTKLAVLGIGIAAVVPQLIFEVFFPRWFDITASKETVDY